MASGGNDNRVRNCKVYHFSEISNYTVFFTSPALVLMIYFISLQLFVWNQHSTQPVLKYCEHTAAVKAIAWSPHLHGLLASGGGTADRCIRFWNTTTNSHLSCMDTGSQVKVLLHNLFILPYQMRYILIFAAIQCWLLIGTTKLICCWRKCIFPF